MIACDRFAQRVFLLRRDGEVALLITIRVVLELELGNVLAPVLRQVFPQRSPLEHSTAQLKLLIISREPVPNATFPAGS